jgi:hypothetical protein
LSFTSGARRASRRTSPRHLVGLGLLATCLGAGAALAGPAPALLAASAPKVAIIVGPAGAQTSTNRDWANAAASEALPYTSNIVKAYSPNATGSRVKTAISGAAIVVYIGRGRGFPSPYSSTLETSTQDGFGLNPVAGVDNSTTRYYGESYIRAVRLAPGAVVLLGGLDYASGNNEPGRTQPSPSIARRRVDNYGASFVASGAAVVIAEAKDSLAYYIRSIFTRDISLDNVWRTSPWRNGHVTSFTSTRTLGAVGRTDPLYPTSGYYRSIVGCPATLTTTARHAGVTATPGEVSVPASIDATGTSDASSAMNSWLRTVPDGSTIVFRACSVYRMDAFLLVVERHNLTFEGNGATLRSNGTTSCGGACSLFYFLNSRGITIRNFNLVGNSPTPGVYSSTWEQAAAVRIMGGSDFEISGLTIRAVGGDGLYAGNPTNVSFHNNHIVTAGRNGVSVISGTNITAENNAFDKVGYVTFDDEADHPDEASTNVVFRANTAGTYGARFASVEGGHTGAAISGVTISGNTVTGRSLLTVIDNGGTARMRNIAFTGNSSTVAAAGPVLEFAHIDGLTVIGNVQPLTSGVLASISDCTGVTYR